MSVPAISVLMPVYNSERYLAEAVESILGQTFKDFEFIIIDDGSTDGSRAMLERYAAKDSRVRLVSRPNTGYVVALNEMLGMARAPVVARMDADDVSASDRFARQTAYLAAHPECVAVGGRVMLVDEGGRALREFSTHTTHEEIDAAHMAGAGGAIAHPAAMIRTEVIRRVGGYRVDMGPAEDLDLFLRLAEIGRLANISERVLSYRIHLRSVGHAQRQKQQRGARAALREAAMRRGVPEPVLPPPNGTLDIAGEHCKWAWWALGGGFPATARRHAVRAVGRAPWRLGHWKALACAIRGW